MTDHIAIPISSSPLPGASPLRAWRKRLLFYFNRFIRKVLSSPRLILAALGVIVLLYIFAYSAMDTTEGVSEEFPADPHYFVMIDAGSSGSRVQIFQWKKPSLPENKDTLFFDALPVIYEPFHPFKTHPGISSYANDEEGLKKHIHVLIDNAMEHVPAQYRSSTPFLLFATAGMRLLTTKQQQDIIQTTCRELEASEFYFKNCEAQVKVITGEMEGIYGWLSVNYMTKAFDEPVGPRNGLERASTFGFLDMGGASAQIAFEPDREVQQNHLDDLRPLEVVAADGRSKVYNVYSRTFLGYGANEARRRYLHHIKQKNVAVGSVLKDPCMHDGLEEAYEGLKLRGTGNFSECRNLLIPILNETATCYDQPCFFAGVHAPERDLSMEKWIAVSEYWYTTNTFDLGGTYQYHALLRETREFCESSWDKASTSIEEDDERLKLQCFKMAWVMTMLHEGFDLPIDPKATKLESKDDINKKSISWTLGAVFLQLVTNKAFLAQSKEEYQKQLLEGWNKADPLHSTIGLLDTQSYVLLGVIFGMLFVICYYLYRQGVTKSGVQEWMSHRSNRYQQVSPLQDLEMSRFSSRNSSSSQISRWIRPSPSPSALQTSPSLMG